MHQMTEPISNYIDHTLLKSVCTLAEIEKLCQEAVENRFAAVCVPPFVVPQALEWLTNTPVHTATVIGFPFGYSSLDSKMAETRLALQQGVDELDVVINLIALKNKEWSYVEKEIKELVSMIHGKGKIIKVIVESGVLSDEEIGHCCSIFGPLGIDFMKTSTGYAEPGATVEAVQLMRSLLPPTVQIKASGGIRHYAFAKELLDAGASRLGCSAGLQILKEEKQALSLEKIV